MVTDFFKSYEGRIILSILFGLALASLFRQVCNSPQCMIFKGPPMEEITNHVYKVKDDCFRFEPNIIDCKEKIE